MSAEMTPETTQETGVEQSEPLRAVEQNEVEKSDKERSDLMARIRKLDQANTNLKKDLEKRDREGKTVDERVAILEREREQATERARTIEAFADSGLGESWRKIFEESDPYKRADGVNELLKQHTADVTKKLATELGTAEAPELGKSGKPFYTMQELEAMSEADINKAFKEGRVEGMK